MGIAPSPFTDRLAMPMEDPLTVLVFVIVIGPWIVVIALTLLSFLPMTLLRHLLPRSLVGFIMKTKHGP